MHVCHVQSDTVLDDSFHLVERKTQAPLSTPLTFAHTENEMRQRHALGAAQRPYSPQVLTVSICYSMIAVDADILLDGSVSRKWKASFGQYR